MNEDQRIESFLSGSPFAVVGASADPAKYGNKVLKMYQQHNIAAHPINPKGGQIEGLPAYPDLDSLPEPVHGISIITPPNVTEKVVEDAIRLGIKHIWMQPGAESASAVSNAEAAGINLIAHGACILVVLRLRD